MRIIHLADLTKCPCCDSTYRTAHVNGKHTNGQQFESVSFNCGAELTHIPNFDRTDWKQLCPHSPIFTEINNKVQTESNALKQRLIKIGVSDQNDNLQQACRRIIQDFECNLRHLLVKQIYQDNKNIVFRRLSHKPETPEQLLNFHIQSVL